MAELSDSFEMMMDSDLWVQAAVILAAFLAPTVLHNLLAGRLPMSVPDEGYGVAVIVGAQYLPEFRAEATTGGAVYVVDKAAERAGLKQEVTQLGA